MKATFHYRDGRTMVAPLVWNAEAFFLVQTPYKMLNLN